MWAEPETSLVNFVNHHKHIGYWFYAVISFLILY